MKINRLMFFFPAIVFALAIFIESHQSRPVFIDLGFSFQDKVYHLTGYFLYGLAISFGIFGFFRQISAQKAIFRILVIGISFGALDEIHQYFIPGRDCDIFDFFADCIGIASSLCLIRFIRFLIKKIN